MSKSKNNNQFDLTRSFNAIKKTQDTFSQRVEDLKSIIDDAVLMHEQKRHEIEALQVEFDTLLKSKRVEVDLDIRQYGIDAAMKIIEAQGFVAVPKNEYDALNKNYEDLKTTNEDAVKQAVDDVLKREKRSCEYMKRQLELTHQAKIAQIEAELKAQQSHVNQLNGTIERLHDDVESQRKLTESVSNRAAPSVYIGDGKK